MITAKEAGALSVTPQEVVEILLNNEIRCAIKEHRRSVRVTVDERDIVLAVRLLEIAGFHYSIGATQTSILIKW